MKATQAQIEQRVSEVLKLRVAGAEFDDIRQYASVQQPPWDVSDRQLWRYVAASDEALLLAVEKDRGKLLARHLAQRRLLYAKALETGNWNHALAALKDESELLHLYDAAPPTVPEGEAPPQGARDLVAVLGTLVNQLRRGEVDATTAAAVCNLAGVIMRAEESTELAAQMKELQELMKRKAS